MYLKVLLLVIAGASLGSPQLMNLTRDRELTCAGETVQFTCIAEMQVTVLQWIAEPYVNSEIVINNNNIGSVRRLNGVVIVFVSRDPFVTTLTINGTTANSSTSVICSTVGGSPDVNRSLLYIANDGLVQPVHIFKFTIIDDDDDGFDFMVTFTSSSSPDVGRYIMCIDDNCRDVLTRNQTIYATGRCPNIVSCIVSVRAINRCGSESVFESRIVRGPVKPVRSFLLFKADDDSNWFSSRIIGVFTPSSTPDVTHYVVNCTDNACNEFVLNGTENFLSIDVGSSCIDATYSMSIVAIDRDGESRAVIASVDVKEAIGYCVVASLFTIIVFVLLIAFLGLLIYLLYEKFNGKKLGDAKKTDGDKQQSESDEAQANIESDEAQAKIELTNPCCETD